MDIIERILNGDIDHISLEDLANALRTEGYLDLPSFHRMRSYTNCPHCGIGVSASDLSVRNIHLHAFVNTDLMTERKRSTIKNALFDIYCREHLSQLLSFDQATQSEAEHYQCPMKNSRNVQRLSKSYLLMKEGIVRYESETGETSKSL